MAGKERPPLTEAELRIMRVLWARGEATVGDVVDDIETPRLARNTVMTMLGILERKGYAKHRTDGRSFVYRARIGQEAVQHGVIDYMLSRFFDDSPEQLMTRLIDSEHMSKIEADRIRRLFQDREGEE